MKVQIYEHTTPEEAQLSIQAGVNFIGVVTGENGRLQWETNFATCRSIFAAIPHESHAMRVALTVASDPDEIIETIEAVKPDVIHLSGKIEALPVSAVAALRQAVPMVKIMQAIPVSGPQAIDLAIAYQAVSDYLILDTMTTGSNEIGATGAVHDWQVSAEIVRRVNIPVIMAGGLGPDNVAEAIRVVKPWCVDSFTRTNQPGQRRKNAALVEAFVNAARAAI